MVENGPVTPKITEKCQEPTAEIRQWALFLNLVCYEKFERIEASQLPFDLVDVFNK